MLLPALLMWMQVVSPALLTWVQVVSCFVDVGAGHGFSCFVYVGTSSLCCFVDVGAGSLSSFVEVGT